MVTAPRRREPYSVFSSRNYPSVRLKVNGGDVESGTVKRSWSPASVLVTILLFSVSIGVVLCIPISYTTTYETSVGISSVTSLQVTSYNYVTSYWTSAVTPYAYFASSENQLPTVVAILALSIIVALSFLVAAIRRARANEGGYEGRSSRRAERILRFVAGR